MKAKFDYILKPIKEMDELVHVIENNLEKSRLRMENKEYQNHLELMVAQKTAEVKKTNDKLDSIIKTVPDIIYRLDDHGVITFLSDSVRNYGYEPDELIGSNIFSIIHPAYLQKVENRINERRTGDRRTRELEVVILTKNMDYVSFEVKYRDLLFSNSFEVEAEGLYNSDEEGHMAFLGTQGILRDISQRKIAEKKLKESEKRFRTLAEYAPDMIQIWDDEGKIALVNKLTCHKLQYEENELLKIEIQKLCPEIFGNINKYDILNLEPGEKSITFLTQFVSKNKEFIPVELRIGTIILNEKKYIVGIGRDITDRVDNEVKKQELEKQLRQAQKMEAIGLLAGGISHDFNNMLTPILGYSDLLKTEFKNDSFAYKGLFEIQKAATRAADLVKQILTFSRQKEKQRESIYLDKILNEAIKLLRGSIPPTIKLKTIIDKNCSPVSGDPTQMHQIIMNICTNSYQAFEGKDGLIEIKLEELDIQEFKINNITTIKKGKYNKISFRDTGCGMDAKTQEHIFEPYFTTKEKGKGTGLGLATVHGIVKNHSGYIFCESEVSVGTIFTIYLPVPTIFIKKEVEIKNNSTNLKGNEQVLLVDDENNVLKMMEIGLENLGYRVSAFQESIPAFESFEKNPEKYELLILDQIMPKLTGINMAKKVKAIKPNLPIILHTGFSDAIKDIEKKYIDEFFLKPVRIRDIAIKMRELLGKNKIK